MTANEKVKKLKQAIALLLSTKALSGDLEKEDQGAVDAARQRFHATSDEEQMAVPTDFVGTNINIDGVVHRVLDVTLERNPKNAYAGCKVILNSST